MENHVASVGKYRDGQQAPQQNEKHYQCIHVHNYTLPAEPMLGLQSVNCARQTWANWKMLLSFHRQNKELAVDSPHNCRTDPSYLPVRAYR